MRLKLSSAPVSVPPWAFHNPTKKNKMYTTTPPALLFSHFYHPYFTAILFYFIMIHFMSELNYSKSTATNTSAANSRRNKHLVYLNPREGGGGTRILVLYTCMTRDFQNIYTLNCNYPSPGKNTPK